MPLSGNFTCFDHCSLRQCYEMDHLSQRQIFVDKFIIKMGLLYYPVGHDQQASVSNFKVFLSFNASLYAQTRE